MTHLTEKDINQLGEALYHVILSIESGQDIDKEMIENAMSLLVTDKEVSDVADELLASGVLVPSWRQS